MDDRKQGMFDNILIRVISGVIITVLTVVLFQWFGIAALGVAAIKGASRNNNS
jgi:hypothetical protein